MGSNSRVKIFSGSAHPQLTEEIAKELKTDLGKTEIGLFPNGEKRVWIKEGEPLSAKVVIKLLEASGIKETGETEFWGIKGRVAKKNVLIFDDFVSTGQTLIKAAEFLKEKKAKEITACITHYLLVKGLPEKLEKSQVDKIFVTNTLPITKERKFPKLKVISIAPLIAKAVKDLLG